MIGGKITAKAINPPMYRNQPKVVIYQNATPSLI